MANLNPLPDLSTVDIQAIQDSGPVHPRILLPPLTTIAENWDSVELSSRNLTVNEESCTEDDEEDSEEDEYSHGSNPGIVQDQNSHRTSCSSSSSAADSGTDSSGSELSDATSDSVGSSSSSSDSESDSQSSVSSSSSKSKILQTAVCRDKTSFSVREANYDKGRVTLRLSTLQLGRKQDINEVSLSKNGKVLKNESVRMANVTSGETRETDRICVISNQLHDGTTKSRGTVNQKLMPVKRTRQLRIRPSEAPPLKVEPSKLSRSSSAKQPNTPRTVERIRGKGRNPSVCKKQESLPTVADTHTTDFADKKNDTQTSVSAFQSAPTLPVAIGPSMSDLDSDSDELCLPSVSEAIRMLDLDSQASTNENDASKSQNTLPTSAPLRLPISLMSANNVSGNSWPSVGYCSSILQQFVAKSQSGEPPPPPPTLMLPTKGARKCFPPNDEPLSSIINSSDPGNVKRVVDNAMRSSSFGAVTNVSISASVVGGHADQELDMLVPLRGLDCHQSHVSPDSGIQSVSGSPFSVHSSPVHPSAAGCNNNQTNSQPQPIVVSPCPPIPSPSPPPRKKQATKKSAKNMNSTTKNQDISFPTATKVKSSGSRKNGSRNRRPRSCRDTASALSSGLCKDSSILQAIQRGMNDALRLKRKGASEERNCPSQAIDASVPVSSTENLLKNKSCTKKKHKNGNDKRKEAIKTISPVVELPFRNETAAQKNSTVTESNGVNQMQSVQQKQIKPSELKVATTSSPSPKCSKRKKKRKKHKNSVHDQDTAVTVDPNLLNTLDSLCTRLDRCVISRSVAQNGAANCDKKPCVFQPRKYAITNVSNGSGNSRTKRKKMVDEVGVNSNNSTAKRKGKPKKTGSYVVSASNASNVETSKEGEPTVAVSSAAAALSAVELLLPLKKRHHHVATSETPIVESASIEVHHCNSTVEKPSHVQVLTKVVFNQPQQPNSRKRAANSESITESTEIKGTEQEERKIQGCNNQKSRKGRSHKKAKMNAVEDVIAAVAAAVEAPIIVSNDQKFMETSVTTFPTTTPVQEDGDAQGNNPSKKKHRRRKTFNRTGFPSVKKKRKKPPSPIPNPPVPQVSCKEIHETTNPSVDNLTSRQAKRAKIMPKEEKEEGILPEPTSSEAPSCDESNPIQPLPSIKGSQPKKRRNSTMRKRYLPAGLLSNYFKEDAETSSTTISVPAEKTKVLTYEPEEHEHGLLPPPFYCERLLRRTRRDFQLPFDIWWLHEQGKLPGRDNVPSWNYKKIRTNVYYDVKPPFTNDAEACNCTLPPPDARDAEAQCCGEDCLNRMVYTECNSQMCPVGDKCLNQRIQRHRWAQGLERFMTKEKGWGVRCRNELKSGMFILEYVGEVVSDKEFKERMHTIYVHDTHHYCLHLDGGLVIDGHRMGGDGRFVNHSCAPNCEIQKWSVNGLPRMALFALRDISPLEELSYDYNFSLFNPAEGQPCKCGSTQCRGVIGGKSQRVNVMGQDVTISKLPQKLSQQKRKRKTQIQGKTSLAICSSSINLRPLSTQQRVFVLQHRCFLLRNLDKVREWRDRQKDKMKQAKQQHQTMGRTRRFVSRPIEQLEKDLANHQTVPLEAGKPTETAADLPMLATEENKDSGEEIVSCRCRLFNDEGLMVQCEKCETWQHGDCLGSDAKAAEAEHYICHSCAGVALCREDFNIVLMPQPENPPEGCTYFLSLHYKDLQLRQGDCVYVLRDHDTPDSERTLWSGPCDAEPTPRPPHLPSHIKLANLDIFQIERIWTDENGKQFVHGHHFFRPQDTYHEPSRKFYVNEVLHSPIQEAIPIWAVAGRCWVLDPTTFCKGRPIDVVEEHVYICEYRVDRTARLFSKNSRSKFPICTRRFAFNTFVTRLKPQRTFQPHGAPQFNSRKANESPAMKSVLKSDKSGKENAKKLKQETLTQNQPSPSVTLSTAQVQIKVQQRKLRLDKLLRDLLVQKTPEGSSVEDATHLLHRGRGRMRRRPTKQKTPSST